MPSQPQGSDSVQKEKSATIGFGFNLPDALPYIVPLRKTTCLMLKASGISETDTNDPELIIGELATNAVRHAKGGNYCVDVELHDDLATVTVTDSGIGFDSETILEPGALRTDDLSEGDSLRIGGFGLSLVSLLADHASVEPNKPQGMIVKATKTVYCPS